MNLFNFMKKKKYIFRYNKCLRLLYILYNNYFGPATRSYGSNVRRWRTVTEFKRKKRQIINNNV